ncbi:TPA: hypothetical protein NPO38_000250 [Klebsiella quasipneumoniae subsp. quasipneumoniae]|nr:hypothetical protein [Klebsiella quasipneumoniae subsp. quasipneumoniae]
MKLIGNLLCIGFIIWVVSFFVKAEKKELPSNEVLISQFDNMEVFNKDEWKKGSVVEGVQVYTARTDDKITKSSWLLGVKQVGLIAISDKNDSALESISVLASCYKLVKGVLGRDDKGDFKVVEDTFRTAISSEPIDNTRSDTGVIDGYRFKVQMGPVAANLNSYSCSIKEK